MARRNLDNYQTTMAADLVSVLSVAIGEINGRVLCPCAGNGHMERAIKDTLVLPIGADSVTTNDINTEYSCDFHDDATDPNADMYQQEYDWVVDNPPFSLVPKILPLVWEVATVGVAFLLRLTYAEPAKNRYRWLQERADNQRYQIPFNPRPRFLKGISPKTGKKLYSDRATVAWFVWMKGFSWAREGVFPPPFMYAHGWR